MVVKEEALGDVKGSGCELTGMEIDEPKKRCPLKNIDGRRTKIY